MHAISCGEAVPACDALWGGGACIEYPVRGVQGSYSCLATFSATLTLTGAYSCTKYSCKRHVTARIRMTVKQLYVPEIS